MNEVFEVFCSVVFQRNIFFRKIYTSIFRLNKETLSIT